jgi:hypothetical protein
MLASHNTPATILIMFLNVLGVGNTIFHSRLLEPVVPFLVTGPSCFLSPPTAPTAPALRLDIVCKVKINKNYRQKNGKLVRGFK